jgi:hypothetical protein
MPRAAKNKGSAQAKHNPAIIRKTLEAAEQELGGNGVANMAPSGAPEITHDNVIVADRMPSTDKAELLQFMAEKCRVQILNVSDEQADPNFTIAVNGEKFHFFRDQEYTIPRYVVEGLARAKPVGYKNEEFTMQDGTKSVRWPKRAGLRYPFAVIGDTERGKTWLQGVLRQE